MSMMNFLIRRIIYSVFVLLGLSIVIFIIARIMPGDPARVALGARAPNGWWTNLREQMHLNDPLPVQYGYWLRDAVQGDFGLSLVTQRPVTSDIQEFFPASLELVFLSGLLSAVGGIGLGIVSARYKDTWVDNVCASLFLRRDSDALLCLCYFLCPYLWVDAQVVSDHRQAERTNGLRRRSSQD